MKIGIGLPAAIPGTKGSIIVEWAKRADAGPFSSLGLIDRFDYPNYEPMIALAAAAAVTQRIRLMVTVLLVPIRNAALVAKQSASLDVLSGGRFSLGIGVGAREGDYDVTQMSFHDRGKRLDKQLETMKRIWAGERLVENAGVIGPLPVQKGGPELLIGGYGPAMIRRVARWGDGYISGGGGTPPRLKELYPKIIQAWQAAGRPGKPRLVGGLYYGLGPHAAERMPVFMRDYYANLGPNLENMVKNVSTTPEAVERTIRTYADVGMDELIFWPTFSDLDQVDRLAEVVSKL